MNSLRMLVVSTVMVAVAAATGIYVLGYWAKQTAQTELLLAQISAELHELSSLEWRAIAMMTVDAGIEHKVSKVEQRIDQLRGEIKESEDGELNALNAMYRDYTLAMRQEFSLIKSKKLVESHEFDKSVVDPLFDKLHDKIETMVAESAEATQRIGSTAETGMVISLLSAALIGGTMFSAFTVSRARHAQKLSIARELTELSSDASWEQDAHFRFTRFSTTTLETGLSPLMIGATPWQLPVDPDASDWPAHRAMLEAHQPFKNFEYKLLADGMSVQWLSASGKPQFDADGNFTGYRGTSRNITDRKLAEEALRHSQAELRQLAANLERVKEDERKRIAQDIHDDLGQNLLALKMDVATLLTRTGEAHPKLHQRARIVLHNIDATIQSVKSIINDLRPATLELGLYPAVEWQIKQFERRNGIACKLASNSESVFGLDEGRTAALFRILQESLTNVVSHAEATEVEIALNQDERGFSMQIQDNGKGLQLGDYRKPNSFGLIGIRERIDSLGGELTIASRPGQGTLLSISIPIVESRVDA